MERGRGQYQNKWRNWKGTERKVTVAGVLGKGKNEILPKKEGKELWMVRGRQPLRGQGMRKGKRER